MRLGLWSALLFASIHFYSSNSCAAFDSAAFNAVQEPLSITQITPSGEDIPPARQVVIQFNRPVVPVGRMDRDSRDIPISIEPALKCEWRWLNTSSLACQLNEQDALREATKYHMTIHPGITAEDGATLKETVEHSFITERPKVERTDFVTWNGPGTPVIRIFFNQPVDQSSLKSHLVFVSGVESREAVVEPDPEIERYQNGESRIWRAWPKQEMPLGTNSSLNVKPGILPEKGGQGSVEDRAVVSFKTFPKFSFLGVECWTNKDKRILVAPSDKPDSQKMCNPLGGTSLVFNTPVFPSQIRENLSFLPDLAGGRDDYDPWEDSRDYTRLRYASKEHRYQVRIPEVLQAYQPYTLNADSGSIIDEFGRKLPEPIRMMIFTDHRKPDFTLWYKDAVLEKHEQSDVPLVVTNLNSLSVDYTTLTPSGVSSGQSSTDIPKVQDIGFKFPLGIRDMLDAPSGAVQGTFQTDPIVQHDTYFRTFFAQVTPWSVHAKVGHYNTLVWVTDLETGEPVPGVTVEVFKDSYPGMQHSQTVLSSGLTGNDGTALMDGTDKLDPDLETFRYYRDGLKLFVRCRLGDDFALLPITGEYEARYREHNGSYVWNRKNKKYGHMRSWGTTSQGIYRAGDTVDYKVYVRDQDNRSFISAPKEGYSLEVTDPMGKNVVSLKDITLNEFGAFHNSFVIPKNGAVGWYQFTLNSSFLPRPLQPMRVLVSDFTPAPFKATCDLNGELFRPGEKLEVATTAKLHSGGPYADAPARVTVQLTPRTFKSKDPEFSKYFFDTVNGNRRTNTLHQEEKAVDSLGNLTSNFTLVESSVVYGSLRVESAIRDDRGKYVAASSQANYIGRDRLVGVRQDDWVLEQGKPAALHTVVVDDSGSPVDGAEISIKVEYRRTVASRVKGAGNAYVTRYEHRWEDVSSTKLVSSAKPQAWHFTPEEPGQYRVISSVVDTQGRSHQTQFERWAIGKGRVLWSTSDGHGLQITPEKNEFNIGEKARFLVQNPFPGAKALVTVERFGTLKQWVTTLEDSTAIVEVDVEPDFLPGFYLSVSIASPRVDQPLGENQVDLGKPTFRMGYVSVPVHDPVKKLNVHVAVDGEQFKPRDTVSVDVSATRNDGVEALPPVEYAVAVLDESVLDLVQGGTGNWDVYRGFYKHDTLDVANYHLLMRIVGRQKFEKKGANAGGDGGPDLSMRTLFKFVSYWNPSIKADENGKARFEFEVPDNLTGWRVLVMAVTPDDRMGLGQDDFKVNRPTELRPALPNQVIEGDRFRAGFTVMNRTEKERTLKVEMLAEGALAETAELSTEVVAAPYKRIPVWLPVATQGTGEVKFTVKAWDQVDGDALQEALSVLPWSVLETAATYGTTDTDLVTESIAVPFGVRTDVGSIGTTVSTSVVGNLQGAFDYMRDYPYICWEQQLSKGVMASHYVQLKNVLPEDFSWPGVETVTQSTLALAAEHQAPNGGMVYYIPQNEYVSPYLSAYTAIAFNWLRAAGHQIPADVETRLHDYLEKMLRQDVFPTFYSKGMASTVRAVALAALSTHGQINRSDLDRYRQHLSEMSLFGKAHYLLAALNVQGTEDLREEVAQMIMSHANETGGKFIFQEQLDTGYSQLLTSTLRDNGAVLSALLAYAETPQGGTLGQVPFKLVRALTQSRGQRDRWENTQENLFCLNALIEYRRIYETTTPDMEVAAILDGEAIGKAEFKAFIDPPVTLERPIRKSDPGSKMKLDLQRKGAGRVYYGVRLKTAPAAPRQDAVNSGIEVRREISLQKDGEWQLLKSPVEISRGDLVRVDLFVSLPAARNFVVVDDPVPGGLEPVNRDLATASVLDASEAGGKYDGSSFWHTYSDWREYGYSYWSFYHKELRHHSARFYSEYLPAGNYHLSYVAQAIAPGEFSVMPTKAEEMYDPDVYGLGVPAVLRVKE